VRGTNGEPVELERVYTILRSLPSHVADLQNDGLRVGHRRSWREDDGYTIKDMNNVIPKFPLKDDQYEERNSTNLATHSIGVPTTPTPASSHRSLPCHKPPAPRQIQSSSLNIPNSLEN